MPQIEITPYRRISKSKPKNQTKKEIGINKRGLLLAAAGFFIAMATPYPSMAPFGISFLAGERKLSLRAFLILIAVSLGSFFCLGGAAAAKYVGAGVLYLTILFVLEKGVKVTDTAAAISAAACILTTGFTVLFWQDISPDSVLLLLCEAAAAAAGVFVIDRSRSIFESEVFDAQKLTGEERLSLAAVTALAIMGLKEIYIGYSFSIMNMAAAVILLTVAAGCGTMYSTGCGVVLGLVCGIGTDYFMPVLGALSFCGFVSGMFQRFGKGGVLMGLILANAVLIVYTNGAYESMLSIYEILAAAVLFMIIPSRLSSVVRSIVYLDKRNKESIVKLKNGIKGKLAAAADSFADMANTLSRLSDKTDTENSADVAVLFDAAADKVCQNCRKAPVCWGKDFNETYKTMFGLLEIMEKTGNISSGDMEDCFGARCLNKEKLQEELLKQFDVYQVRRVWKSKLAESRELVGRQLDGVSQIIGGIANEIEENISCDLTSAGEIRARLEGKGFKVRDINVVRDKNGKCTVALIMKRSFLKEGSEAAIKSVMRAVLGSCVTLHNSFLEEKGFVRLEFCEEERFRIETGCASRGASEKNGDNYSLTHLGCGKYVIAISDGMGTGLRASRESRAIIDLLGSFLKAGFNSRLAVDLINSIMVMKSENEAFVTVDMCIIDLYTGEAEFIKTGAEPSFIRRSGFVEKVKSASLPVGVIADAEAEITKLSLYSGDMVVMMTDGIESRENGDSWIGEYIGKSAEDDANKMANNILCRAIDENGGTVKDDMTVISIRLRQKNEIADIA